MRKQGTPAGSASRGPGRPRSVKAANTRARIVDAAREVFNEVGYDAATFQAIAVRADLTRPAINHHFAHKRLLYQEVVWQTHARVVQAGAAKAADEPGLLGQLAAFIAAVAQADVEDRSGAVFLLTSIMESARRPELRGADDSLADVRAFLAAAINGAVERGEIRVPGDVAAVVEMLLAALCGIAFYAGYVSGHGQLRAITEQSVRLLAGQLWQARP
jgi:AcrR family transcriptional regulator